MILVISHEKVKGMGAFIFPFYIKIGIPNFYFDFLLSAIYNILSKMSSLIGDSIVIVFLNDEKIETFAGARVRDAILKYSKEEYKAVLKGNILITDKYNNQVHLEGELTDDQRLYLRRDNKESFK